MATGIRAPTTTTTADERRSARRSAPGLRRHVALRDRVKGRLRDGRAQSEPTGEDDLGDQRRMEGGQARAETGREQRQRQQRRLRNGVAHSRDQRSPTSAPNALIASATAK